MLSIRGPFWLGADPVFPDPELAHSSGLLAVGGDLAPERVLLAYRSGIFPWPMGDDEDPLYWFSPDPRFVLYPEDLRLSSSLRKVLRGGRLSVSFDLAFEEVVRACAATPRGPADGRDGRDGGTWITDAMVGAYCRLHSLGWAHSVESWEGDRLVGGLYGIAIGGVFFGESMFYRVRDASKVAFATLVTELARRGARLIDCQQETPHLARFGAKGVARSDFLAELAGALVEPECYPPPGHLAPTGLIV